MTLAPFASPLYVMAKPVGSLCNLACDYCYYLEKHHLYDSEQQYQPLMSDATLEAYIRQYIESQTQPEVLFTWHGGEPLMRPLSFYQRVIALQRQYAQGHLIDNCLQTNGTLLTDEWCAFFRRHNWLIGISIDGPEYLHDHYRLTRRRQPSFQRVMRGIRLLQKHGVEWNAMGVVNRINADYPLDVYHFYKDIGCRYIQFTPIVERLQAHPDGRHLAAPTLNSPLGANDTSLSEELSTLNSQLSTLPSHLAPYSVLPGQYSHFICTLFDEWVRHDVGDVFVQLFDSTLARWMNQAPGVCSMSETCGHAAALEHNGDLYSCDHYVFPEYLLGNIHTTPIASLMYSPRQIAFGRSKRDSLSASCRSCQWLFACNGGCPKDRFVASENYLCQDYRSYFAHVAPYMDFMRNELLHQRPPANIMRSTLIHP